ncbi:peptidoglycan editing factor PgeF [Arenicella chitinivorans]|uniref:peptidoglycan editing factor PgeF n=1 Tax=Arenicella chitinivorans TaxID=1329800 RepID=UPI00357169FD
MQIETPSWNAPAQVKALSTLRVGGQSRGVYASLNLADYVGDDDSAVTRNRALLASVVGLPQNPNWLQQVHGTQIIDFDRTKTGSARHEADGATTTTHSVVCAVQTADCLPLLMTNRQGTRVAAVHVGWRGMAAGIIENAVAKMRSETRDILVWAGPCIGAAAFEVGVEVQAQLRGPAAAYRPASSNDKVYADLRALAGDRLLKLGVTQYFCSESCTYQQDNAFFSYRRDGQCGRMASLIWIQP